MTICELVMTLFGVFYTVLTGVVVVWQLLAYWREMTSHEDRFVQVGQNQKGGRESASVR